VRQQQELDCDFLPSASAGTPVPVPRPIVLSLRPRRRPPRFTFGETSTYAPAPQRFEVAQFDDYRKWIALHSADYVDALDNIDVRA
jgi:hypothetical protein